MESRFVLRQIMSLDKEQWRDVEGHEGVYQVSDLGRVRRLAGTRPTNGGRLAAVREKTWPGYIDTQGYYSVSLGRGRKATVHRLVCSAFNGRPPTGKNQVAHYDGNKLNNRATNLRWADHKDNRIDGRRLGEIYLNERHWKARLSAEVVLAMRSRFEEVKHLYGPYSIVAREFGVLRHHANQIVKRRLWPNI